VAEEVHDLSRQLHPSILDDLGLVQAVQAECAAFARKTGIDISFAPYDFPDSVPQQSSLCLYRVIQEALQNISKHSGAASASITLQGLSDGIRLLIATRDRVRSQGVKTKAGIGLSSMRERVRLVNGTISFKSNPGQGSEIEVFIPIGGSMTKPRLLIADDHQIFAEGLKRLLSPGFDIVGAVQNGRELVAAAEKLRPDVIVADISMPMLNGIEAVMQIKKVHPEIKIVFLTMHPDAAYAVSAFKAAPPAMF